MTLTIARVVLCLAGAGVWVVLNDYFYVADERGLGNPDWQWIENQTEIMVCTDPDDPGSTEIFADYSYEEMEPPFGRDLDEDAQWLAQASCPDDYGDPLRDARIPAWVWQRSA